MTMDVSIPPGCDEELEYNSAIKTKDPCSLEEASIEVQIMALFRHPTKHLQGYSMAISTLP